MRRTPWQIARQRATSTHTGPGMMLLNPQRFWEMRCILRGSSFFICSSLPTVCNLSAMRSLYRSFTSSLSFG